MVTRILIIAFMSTEWLLTSGMKEFRCKPRQGCHMARCDPVPLTFRSHLDRNEYPITCVQPEGGEDAVPREEYNKLLHSSTKSLEQLASVQRELVKVTSRVEILEKNVKELTEEQKKINSKVDTSQRNVAEVIKFPGRHCIEENGFPFNGKCYSIAYLSYSSQINYNQAVEKCSSRNSLTAEFNSLAQQRAIEDFFKSRIPSGKSHFVLWIGMTYRSLERNVQLRSGKNVFFDQFKWYNNYPVSGSGDRIAIVIRNDGQSAYGGIANDHATSNYQGVICEKSL